MFNVSEIKNRNRKVSDRDKPLPLEELFEEWPEEAKPMPYISIVPEQFERDQRYQDLSEQEQGRFLRLCLVLAGGKFRGRFLLHAAAMAKRMKVPEDEWVALQEKLVAAGLLVMALDGMYAIQPELREQCLQYARKK